ncbi:hypothetical protein RJ639_019272 [Escallonia herrerae]|uniref:Transposase (putative) gypsy type domain-containing protein n=1 Tax=Escallonia herrerae TaxID=1293975 RepID=A0AA88V9E2_9ASTE|nr:hypothetical protein RJ639_019272 [Escallonia herrerae]
MGQALTDFILECTFLEEEATSESPPTRSSIIWTLFINGSSNVNGSCDDLILKGTCDLMIEYLLWFGLWSPTMKQKLCLGTSHSAQAECSGTILLRQNSVRARVTLLEHNVHPRFCSGRIVFGHEAFCSGMILLGQNSVWAQVTLLGQKPLPPSFSQPPQPSTSQPSHSLPAKNALGDVKDQAEDEANPKPWYTADEKSSKMSIKDLLELIREYPLLEGWYAHLPGLQEPTNYGTKFESGIYEEQVKSGYRFPLYPFALLFFEHYHMAPGQLVPNSWRKLVGLIYLVQTSGYKPNVTDFMRVFFKICFVKGVANCPGWYYIHSRQQLLKGGPKLNKVWHSRYFFVGHLDKGKLPFDRDWNPYRLFQRELLLLLLRLLSLARLLRWLAEVEKQRNEAFLMYASKSEMLSRFEMARQVAAEEAQQKREAIKEAEEATRHAEELSKQETDYLSQIETLKRRLERAKKKVAKEVKKARDKGIRDFLDGNIGDEWLKKRADDGLEIYELGFMKAKEMFVECFPDIPLDDFVLPAVVSPSGETVLPSEVGDAAASHLPGEGPSGDASEP